MRTLLTIAALFILCTVGLAQSPIPQAPGFWEGTWDTYSTLTDDRHEIEVSIAGTANPTGRTSYDVVVDGAQLEGYMNNSSGVLNIGYWYEDENGEPKFKRLYVLWSVSDSTVLYWGHMPNEGGDATKRDGDG